MPNRKPSLRLEFLEGRDNPASITWDGGASTQNWADAANWSTNTLPGASDDVTIDIIGTTATINYNLTTTIKSLTCAENLTVAGGTLTITDASSVNGLLNHAQGTLTLTNTLTATGGYNWSNGTLRGTGGKLLLVEGTTNSIGATNNQTLGATIENHGTLSVVNPNGYFLYFGASNSEPGTLDNYGTLTITNDGDFSYSGHTGAQKIINRGTLNRTGIGTSTVRESVLFDNLGGTISVQGGIFEAGGGGTLDGMTISQGIFDIGNGSFTIPANAVIGGPGTLRMKAGIGTGTAEIVAGTNAQIVNLAQVAGSLSLTNTLTVTGGFNWSNGTLRGTGKLLLAEGTTNSIGSTSNNQTLGATIENRGALSVINPNGYFVYFGASNSEPGTLDNYGTLTVTDDGDFSYTGYTGAQKIINRGTLNRTGIGTSTVRESVLFDNLGGTISVQGGIFEAGGGGTIDGMTIAQGIFDIGNGTFTLPANSTIDGPGTFRMKAGIGTGNAAIVAGTNAQIVNLAQVAGTLALTNTLTVTGGFNWTNGTLRGIGKLLLVDGTTNSIGSPSNNQILGATIENRGTLSVVNPNGYFLYFGASISEPGVLDNYGTLTVTNDGDFNYTGYAGVQKIINRGTLNRIGVGTATIRESVAFDNLGGTISVQGGIFEAGGGGTLDGMTIAQGIFDIGNGSFTIPAGATIDGPGTFRMKAGIGTGNAEIVAGANAQIVNLAQVAGTLSLTNTLTVTGGFDWSNGTLRGTGKLVLTEETTNSIGATSNNQFLGTTIENHGTISVINPNGYFVYFGASNSEPGVLDNYGTMTVTNDGDFSYTGYTGAQKIINRGTLNRTGVGTATVRETVLFDNLGGTISVQGGIFEAGGGGTIDGMTISQGIFDIGNGSFTLPANSTIDGPGTFRMKAGIGTGNAEIIAGANAQIVNLAQVAGSLSLTNTLTVTGGFNWSNGTLRGASGKLLLVDGTTNSIGATSNNQFIGTTIENRGTLSVVNPNGYFVYFGASNSEPGTLDNYGTLTITNDGDFSYTGYTGAQRIINRGTLNRIGIGTATVRETVLFDNLGGTISVQGGIFEAGGGGTIDGMTIAQGIFDIGNGSFMLPANSTVGGPGTFRMKAGIGTGNAEIVAGANAQIANFMPIAGTLGVVGTLTVTSQFHFSGGTLRGTGKLVVANGAAGTIGASASSQILGLTVENRGALTVNNPGQYLYFGASASEPGVLDNYGTLNLGNLNWTINYSGAHTVINRGTLVRNGSGTVTIPSGVAFQLLGGSMDIRQGMLVFASGSNLAFNGTSFLRGNSGATLLLNGSLTGSTTNANLFAPLNLVQFSGGNSSDPRTLEVMGNDLGPTSPSFVRNFAYGAITVSGYTRLVDQFDNNTATSTPEALYVDTLVVNSGSTLDLSGYKLYARASQINGTIAGGSIVILTDSGPLPLNTPTSGRINQVGEIDEWTVYARTGRGLVVRLNPGDGSTIPPANPVLSRGGIEIRDPAGTVIATANGSSAGQVITATVETLPADGTYKLRVKASASQPNAIGNYQVAVYDATIRTHSLRLDTPQTATLTSEYTVDRWNFTAVTNTQVRLRRINSSSDTIQFALRGPNGFEGFVNLSGDSELVTLPTNGVYTLEVIAGGTAGSYAFRLDQTAQATLALDTPVTGTIPGSGTAHLYRLDMADDQLLRVVLRDTRAADRNEVYVKFGSAPTRSSYDLKNPSPGAAQTLLSPTGQAGTWYILVYNDYAPAPGTFEIEVNAGRVFTTAVSPAKHGTGGDATLMVKGVGFVEGTTVALVSGATTFAGTVIATTSTQLQVRFAAGSVTPGVYGIRVTRPTNEQATLPNAFEFTAGGQPDLRATVTVPSNVRYNAIATMYVEYTNAGTVGMPAPLLYVTATQNGKQAAVLSLDAQQVIPNLSTSTLPDGYKHVIRILGHGATPGLLQPGETVRVPIYYSGWLQPWDMSRPVIRFDVQSVTAADTTLVDWSNFLGPLSDADRTALQGTIANYQANLGSTWGQYVRKLNEYVQATTYPGMIPASDVDSFEQEFLRNAGETTSANRSDFVELASEHANREPVQRDPFEYRKKGGLYHFENGEWSLIRDYNDVNHASNAKTIVIIHGQNNTVYTGWQRAIATELTATEPAGTNILAVDWSDWANATSPTSVFPTPQMLRAGSPVGCLVPVSRITMGLKSLV